jgi:hypothetical protein
MTWHWLTWEETDGVIADETLAPLIKRYYASRGFTPSHWRTGDLRIDDVCHFDFPGMVHVDRPYEVMEVAGLRLEIPSEDIGALHRKLEKAPPDELEGVTFYGVLGFMRWLLLTPAQRDTLLTSLRQIAPAAEARAAAFYATRETPNETLHRVNTGIFGPEAADAVREARPDRLERLRRRGRA